MKSFYINMPAMRRIKAAAGILNVARRERRPQYHLRPCRRDELGATGE